MMLKNVISLEARKQRSTFLSAILIPVLGITLITVVICSYPVFTFFEAFQGTILYFTVIGVPLLAVLLAGTAGTGLRREPQRSAEDFLPVPPWMKVLGSYLTSLLFFLFVATPLVLLCLRICDAKTISDVHSQIFGSVWFFFWPLYLLKLHAISFAFSYWWKHPVLAGGIALLMVLTEGLLLEYLVSHKQGMRYVLALFFVSLWIIPSWIGSLASIFLLGGRIERERSVGLAWAALAVFCCTFMILIIMMLLGYIRLLMLFYS